MELDIARFACSVPTSLKKRHKLFVAESGSNFDTKYPSWKKVCAR